MSKYVLKKIQDKDNVYDISDITFEVETDSLPDLLEEFERFLKASGFFPSGSLKLEQE